jgi:uncharacterized OB-fold protein
MPEYKGMIIDPAPNDSEWREYFSELRRRHRLVLRRCRNCGLMRYPPGPACPWCMSLDWDWQEVSGKGTIYSYEIVVHAIQPGFKDWAPYATVLVELDEQRGVPTADEALRIVTNLVDGDFNPEKEENVAIGARVEVCFMDLDDDVALPQFRLSGEPPREELWQFR